MNELTNERFCEYACETTTKIWNFSCEEYLFKRVLETYDLELKKKKKMEL